MQYGRRVRLAQLAGLATTFLVAACGSGGGAPGLPATALMERGGQLYDKWWAVNGQAAPTTDHPAYPAVGQKTGETTWRCKECHGWDALGASGAYATGSHFTGIGGLMGAQADPPQTVFDAIKSGPAHDFSAVLSDADIWDLVAFVKDGIIDMQTYVDPATNTPLGDAGAGQTLYGTTAQCNLCHGEDGYLLDFGGGTGLADLAIVNPWETFHKIRWGHPGSAMPSGVADTLLTTQQQTDVIAYARTLLPTGAELKPGGQLYDKWWVVNGQTAPTTDHPAYPAVGQKTGETTWRCKECHGWDYLGASGAYATGSHFTGIGGVLQTQARAPRTIFDAIKSGTAHDFSAVLSDDDIWDLVAFLKTGTIDMQDYVDPVTLAVAGDTESGLTLFGTTGQCSLCHGDDGYQLDFGGGTGIADLAIANPWETFHKIRCGHPGSAMPCGLVDTMITTQEQVDILAHSKTLLPTGSDKSRGGLLYDKWWVVNGQTAPTTDHPAYPAVGQKTGETTWRCKECHGWDYEGVNGAYATGSHFTGIAGVLPAQGKAPRTIFDAVKSGPNHDFSAVLSDADVWDLVAFVKTGTLDMKPHIDLGTKVALGDAVAGDPLYSGKGHCLACHGADGYFLDFGGGTGLPDLGDANPWETLHKIRWGHPGSGMPAGVSGTGLTTAEQVDILTFIQSLPLKP